MIGELLYPTLKNIEDTLFSFEVKDGRPPDYPDEAMSAATKIFMSVLMDRMWRLQEAENIEKDDRGNMATAAGEELRKLIKTYTGVDSWDFYK